MNSTTVATTWNTVITFLDDLNNQIIDWVIADDIHRPRKLQLFFLPVLCWLFLTYHALDRNHPQQHLQQLLPVLYQYIRDWWVQIVALWLYRKIRQCLPDDLQMLQRR